MPGSPSRRSTRRSPQFAGSPQTCGIRMVSNVSARALFGGAFRVNAAVRWSLTFADAVAVYKDGRVCISILHDPGDDPHGYETAAERWSPVQSVRPCCTRACDVLRRPYRSLPAVPCLCIYGL